MEGEGFCGSRRRVSLRVRKARVEDELTQDHREKQLEECCYFLRRRKIARLGACMKRGLVNPRLRKGKEGSGARREVHRRSATHKKQRSQ